MVTVAIGKTGKPYGIAAGITLNSRVDPAAEAENFLKNRIAAAPGTIIVAGASLSYLAEKIALLFPKAKRLFVYFNPALAPVQPSRPETEHIGLSRSWHPAVNETLGDFLSRNLGELDMESFQLIEWNPGLKAFPELADTFRKELLSVIRRLNGSIVTVSRFGRLWIRNILKNCLHLDNFQTYSPAELPTVITASGPSLHRMIPLLQKSRRLCNVWALPSSLTALLSSDIVPDLVILTDPGYWAFEHVKALRTRPNIPILMPFSAAAGLWHTDSPICIFSQNMFIEKRIFKALNLTPPVIPQHGTVAGTALLAAAMSLREPVIFAGLDLGERHGSFHVHPHAFDTMFHSAQTRLRSLHSLGYHHDRAVAVSLGKALDTYADWFSGFMPGKTPPLYRFCPSAINLPAFVPVEADEAEKLLSGGVPPGSDNGSGFGFSKEAAGSNGVRRKLLSRIVQGWIAALGDLADSISRTGSPSPVFEHAEITELLFYFDFLQLKKIKKLFLLSAHDEGAAELIILLKNTLLFLNSFAGEWD